MIDQNPPSKFAKLKEAAQKAKPATEQAPAPKRDFKSLYLTGQESTPSPAPAPSISTPPPTSAPAFQSPSTPKAPAEPSVTGIFRDEQNSAPKIEMPGPGASVSDFRPQKSIVGLPQEQPSYSYKGMPFTQKDAMAQIYKAQKPADLEGLQVSNDPIAMKGLQKRMDSFKQPQAEPKPKREKSFWENAVDGFWVGLEDMKGSTVRGISEMIDLAGSTPLMPSAGVSGQPEFGDYSKLKKAQAEGKADSFTPDLKSYADSQSNKVKGMMENRGVDTESWGYMVGSLIPQGAGIATAVGVGAINPAAGLLVGAASTGQLTSMAIGSAAQEYDEYVEEKGVEYNPNARLGAMMLSAAAETVSEAIPVAKFIPKQFRGKMAKFMFGNTEISSKIGTDLIQQFANSNESRKQLVKNVLGSMAEGALVEGPTEAFAELGNEFSTWLYKEKEDRATFTEMAERAAKAVVGGSIMGAGIGPMSFGAQQYQNRQRRQQAGKVVIAQDQTTGEALEIVGVTNPPKAGQQSTEPLIYQAIRPNGKVIEVSEDQVDAVVDLSLKDFDELIKGKSKGAQLAEQEVNTQVTNQAASAIDQFRAEFQPFAIPTPMGEVVGLARLDGQDVFVLQDQPNGNVLVQSPGQPRQIVAKNRLQGSQFLPFDQFVSQFGPVPQQAVAPFDPSNPVQAGEEVEIEGQNYVVTGVNYDTNQVALELQDGDNVDVLDIPLEAFQSYRKPAETAPSAPTAPQAPTPAAEAPKSGAAKLRELFASNQETGKEAPTEPVAEPIATGVPVRDLVGQKVKYKGQHGTVRQAENGQYEIESRSGNRVYELPSEITGDSLSGEIGLEVLPTPEPKPSIKKIEAGATPDSFVVDGIPYTANTDEKGNIVSLSFTNEKGQKRTTRDENLLISVEIERNKIEYAGNANKSKVGQLKTSIAEDSENDSDKSIMDNLDTMLSFNMTDKIESVLNGDSTDELSLLQAKMWVEDAIERVETYVSSNGLESNKYLNNLINNLYEAYDNITKTGESFLQGKDDAQQPSSEKPAEGATGGKYQAQAKVDVAPQAQPANEPVQQASQEQAGVGQPTPEDAPAQPVGEGVDPTIPVEIASQSLTNDTQSKFKQELINRGFTDQVAQSNAEKLTEALSNPEVAKQTLLPENKNLRDLWSKETGVSLPNSLRGTMDAIDQFFMTDEEKQLIQATKSASKIFGTLEAIANATPEEIYNRVPEATPEMAEEIHSAANEKLGRTKPTTTNEVQQPQQTGQAGQKDVQAQQNQENRSQEGEGQKRLEGPVLKKKAKAITVPKGKGNWRAEFNKSDNPETMRAILETIASQRTIKDVEANDVFNAAMNLQDLTGSVSRVFWNLASNKKTPKPVFDRIIQSKELEKTASDEAIKSLIDQRSKPKPPAKPRKKTPEQLRKQEIIDREPTTARGFARQWLLNGGKLNSTQSAENRQKGVGIGKGVRDETGMSGREMRSLVGIIDNKNGLSPEVAAERIHETMNAEMADRISVQDLRNALIDVLLSEDRKKWYDLQDAETKENFMNEYDRWVMDQLTPEEIAEFDARQQEESYWEYISENIDELAKQWDEFEQSEAYQHYIEEVYGQIEESGTDGQDQSDEGDFSQTEQQEALFGTDGDGAQASGQQQGSDSPDASDTGKPQSERGKGTGNDSGKPFLNLNPSGNFTQALNAGRETLTQDQLSELEANGRFLDQIMGDYPQLTQVHENEIFDLINSGADRKKIAQIVANKANTIDFDASKPLNLSKQAEASPVTKRGEIERQIKEIQARTKKIQDLAKKRPLSVLEKAEIAAMTKEVNRLQQQYDQVQSKQEATKPVEQGDLFAGGQKAGEMVDGNVNKPEENLPKSDKSPADKPTPKAAALVSDPASQPVKEQLQDVGEKIGGAKKDGIRKYFDKINLNGRILSNIFPKPDIASLLDSGMKPKDVGAIKVAYEFAVQDKKKGPEVIKFYAAYAKTVLAESINLEFKNNNYVFTDYGKSQIELRSAAYEAVHNQLGKEYLSLDLTKARILEMTPEIKKRIAFSRNPVKDFKVNYYSGGDKYFDTKEEAIQQFVEEIKANTKVDAKEYKHKIGIFSLRNGGGIVLGLQRKGKPFITLKDGFKKANEASSYRTENMDDLQLALDRILAEQKTEGAKPRVTLKLINETSRDRVGKDWRNGKDVSSEEFASTFGFRGVEFGNWVNVKERQAFVNATYDSLMDMAQILNVTPKSISLNGELAIAFGSRGSGQASAHYEPGRKVINLTKTKGLGALAHEWYHAMDNYFAGFGEKVTGMKAATQAEFKENTRPEIKAAFDQIKKALEKGEFRKRSKTLDSKKNKDYYGTPVEMAARAFENYVLTRLNESGQINDFLVNYVSTEEWNGEPNMYPYPLGEESKAIREAFDNLTQTVKVDEATPKQPLYMIIGERGASRLDQVEEATVRMDNLAIARQMEAEGIQSVFDAYVKAKAETDRLNKAKDYTTDREVFLADIEKMYQALGYSWFESDQDIHRAMQEAADKNDISLLPPSKGNGLIRMATGWERGADGKWRYEVQDPIIDDQLINELQANEGLANRRVTFQNITYKKYPDGTYDITMVEKGATSIDQIAHYKGIPENELDSYIDSPSIVDQIKNQEGQESAMNNRDGNFDTEGVKEINTEFKSFVTGGYHLPLVAKDKSLYRMYPELKKIVVMVDSKMEGQGAFVERSNGSKIIKVNPKKQPKSEIASTILHEIQHAIQYQEGFAKGGNTNDIGLRNKLSDASVKTIEELEQKIKTLESEYHKIYREWYNKAFFTGRYKGQKAETGKLLNQWQKLEREIKSLKDNTYDFQKAYKEYQRLAGEVEARNVQGRARLSPEERRANTLQSTEDVAREDQIFLEGAGIQMSESAPRPNRAGDLLNRPVTPTQAKQLDKVQAEANRITGNWKNGPAIKVYPNGAAIEAAFPQVEFRDMDRVPGLFYNGKVILNAAHPFHNQPGGTETIILHESIGHFGMGNVINELSAQQGKDADQEYARIMQDVYDRYLDTELMQYVAKTYFGKDPATLSEAEQIEAGEEYIAHTAQTGVKDKWIDGVIAKIREILRKLGFKLQMADAELRAIIGRASRFVVDGPSRMQVEGQIRPSMMIRDTDQTQTPEFKAWFGDSKVVDENGNPLTVYHGTASDFDTFKPRSKAPDTLFEKDFENDVYFFSNSPETASQYAESTGMQGANVMPVKLSIQNPYVIDRGGKGYRPNMMSAWIKQAKDAGHDGLIVRNMRDFGQESGTQYAVFEPTQIKSTTGNVGTFSPTNPDIRYTLTPSGSGIRINDFVPADKQTKIQNRLENSPNFLSNPRYMVQPAGVETKSVENQRRKGFLAGAKAFFKRKPTLKEKKNKASFRENIQDAMLPGRRMLEAKFGKNIPEEQDFYTKENLAADKVVFQIGQMENKYMNPIKQLTTEIQDKYGVTFEQIEDYLIALHNQERRDELMAKYPEEAKANKDSPEWPTGMTTAEANEIIQAYEAIVPQAERDQLNGLVKDLVNFSLDKRKESGLISEKYYTQLKNQYKNYVPLRGFDDHIEYDVTKYSPLKQAKGRKSKAASPLAYLYADAADAIAHGERNKVFQSMLEFAKKNPDNRVFQIKTTYYRKSKKEDGSQTWIEFSEEEARPDREELEKGTAIRGFNPDIMKDVAMSKAGELTLPVWVNGQRVTIQFKSGNEQLVKALKNTSYSKIEGFLKVSQKLNRFLSSAFTEYSPEFGFVNAARDFGMGGFTIVADDGFDMLAKTSKKYFSSWNDLRKHFFSGEKIENSSNPYLKEFMESGAFTGFSQAKEVREVYDELARGTKMTVFNNKVVNFLGDGLSAHNKSIENALRFAYFQALREDGVTIQKAAAKAKDVTVNFRRRGNMTSNIGALYAFFNASVQGIERFTRPFFQSPEVRRKAQIMAGGLFVSGFMQGILFNLIGGIDEEDDELKYDKIPGYIKSMNLILPAPTDSGFFTVPLGYGLNVPFALGELLSSVILGKTKPSEAVWRMLTISSDSFSPLGGYDFDDENRSMAQKVAQFATPTYARPVLDLAINTNFAGFQIVQQNPWDKNGPNSQNFKPTTSTVAVKAAQLINSATGGDEVVPGLVDINPTAMEYLVRQYGGGPLSFAQKMTKTGELLFEGENPLQGDGARKVPFASRFYQDADNSSATTSSYFKVREQVQIAQDRYEKYLKADKVEEADRFYQKNQPLIEAAGVMEDYDKALKSLKKEMNAVRDSDPEYYKELKAEQEAMMKEFNQVYRMIKGDKQIRARDLLGN